MLLNPFRFGGGGGGGGTTFTPVATQAAFTSSGSNVALATFSANWSQEAGAMSVASTNDVVCGAAGGTLSIGRWNANSFTTSHYSTVRLLNITGGSGNFTGVCVRCAVGADTNYNFITDGTTNYLNRHNAGSPTTMGSPLGSWVSGDWLRVDVSGTGGTVTIRIWKALSASPTTWVLQDTWTDTSGSRITGTGYPGLSAYADLVASRIGATVWEGGDVT